MSDRERLDYLAAMAAADEASPEELAELDSLIDSEPQAQRITDEFAEVAASLVLDLDHVEPPPRLLDGVRATLGGATTVMSAQPAAIDEDDRSGVPEPESERPPAPVISLADRRAKKMWAGVAGVAMAAAAAFFFMWQRQRIANDEMTAAVASAEKELADGKQDYEDLSREYLEQQELGKARGRQISVVQSAGVELKTIRRDDGPTMKIFIDPTQQRWLVYGFSLPELGADKDYQLWFVPDGKAPVPAGLLERGDDGIHFAEVVVPDNLGDVGQAAVSLEPKGGSKTPTKVEMIGPI